MCGRLPEDSRVAHRYKGLEAELKGEGDQDTLPCSQSSWLFVPDTNKFLAFKTLPVGQAS